MIVVASALAADLPSVDDPVRTGASSPADAALVVGIEEYFTLPTVPYATRDAEAFAAFLKQTRGVPADRVEQLVGTSNGYREKIEAAAKRLGERVGPGGTAWLYYAGHGAASPTDSRRLLLDATTSPDSDVFEKRAFAVDDLIDLAGAGGGSVVAVLDTCYSGYGREGKQLLEGTRMVVPSYAVARQPRVLEWTAAQPNEMSGPLQAARHGAFTYVVLRALQGEADTGDPDGRVTAAEASTYVANQLKALQIRGQTPVLAVEDDGWVLVEGLDVRAPVKKKGKGLAAKALAPVISGAGWGRCHASADFWGRPEPGTVHLAFTVLPSGAVEPTVRIDKTDFEGNGALHECLAETARSLTFPEAAGPTEVVAPIRLGR